MGGMIADSFRCPGNVPRPPMKISIVQLSDIHLKADEKKNRVLTRAEQIANAVLGLHADVAGCVVIASGDTAYSGKESEYDHAETLYGQILSVISKQLCPRQTFFVMIPGNHDCNFDVKDSTRDIVIGNVKPETLTDPDPIVASLGVQREYKKFASSDKLDYQNDLILTTLKGSHLRQIDVESGEQNNILVGYGRLRDIVESSDGTLYVLTSNTDGRGIIQENDDKILKILKP